MKYKIEFLYINLSKAKEREQKRNLILYWCDLGYKNDVSPIVRKFRVNELAVKINIGKNNNHK